MEVIIDIWNEEIRKYEEHIRYKDIKEYDIKCFKSTNSSGLRVIELFNFNEGKTYDFSLVDYYIDMIKLDNFRGDETLKINLTKKIKV